ncbi:MAG: bifunctional 3,4-dihydroxy-2-butanone-4-phosphate synthase/GTP cyclohydrolase II, partial [Polyangiaceae bacterium]|nr:bifunctional 3,4-dihydroxy-2-butanone-4-phosphate synthase/GTP cyclohydrolase II [Polyangiaceae bacterium]
DDGTMARMPDLEKFADRHGTMIVSIADLIQYRTQTERLVHRVAEGKLRVDVTQSDWRSFVYESGVDKQQFLVLVKGDLSAFGEPVPCRVHRGAIIADVFSSTASEGGHNLRSAIQRIENAGCGVVLYLPARNGLLDEFKMVQPSAESEGSPKDHPLREFGLGAQVLADLGLTKISLLTNNPRKIAGIAGYGLEVVDSIPLTN